MLKKFSGVFIAMLLIFFSCADDKTSQGKGKDGMVDFTIKASIPQGIKTYASSDKGGATNVDNAKFSLRYIMEVWDGETVAYREYKTVSNFTDGVTFNVRLLAKDYNFIFWADFVDKDAPNFDLYYRTCTDATKDQNDFQPTPTIAADSAGIGSGLKDIEMLKLDAISDDAKDAYFASRDVNLTNSDYMTTEPVTLQRPFGKYRLISTDVPGGYQTGTALGNVKIDYAGAMSDAEFYTKFNALTGEVSNLMPVSFYTSAAQPENMTVPGQSTPSDVWVLAFDYVFAPPAPATPAGSPVPTFPVAFNTTVYDKAATPAQVGYREISSIPVQRNKLTTVIGNFFTNAALMNIIISDPFDDSENLVEFKTEDTQVIPDASANGGEFFIPNNTITPTYTFDFTEADAPTLSGSTIILRDETPGDEALNYHGNVYLEFTNTPPADLHWDIQLPYATVYLNGLVVSSGSVTASVSTNTLHIDENCKIGTLNLNNGNAEISGVTGVVTTLNAASGCKVFWGVKSYAEISTAMSKAVPNDGLFLMADIKNFTGSINLKNGYTFDGKGHILSGNTGSAKGILTWNGSAVNNVTIKNIEIDNTEPTTTGTHVINIVNSYGNAIENIKLVGSGKMASSGLVINSSSVIATGTIAISGYGLGGYGVDVSKGSTTSYPNTPYFDFSQTTLVGAKFTVLNSTNATYVKRPSWF